MEGSQPPFPASGSPGEEPGNGAGADRAGQPPEGGAPGQPVPGQPVPEQPVPGQPQQYPQYGYQQPAWQQHQAWQQQQAYQQQAQQQQPPQQYGQPAPGQPAPVQTPHGYYQPPGGYPYAAGYYYGQPAGPGNDTAIASLTTAGCSIGALVFTVGIVAPLSLIASIIAVVLGVKGKNAVDAGKTRMHRDLARSGFWVGILGIVLSVLAIAAWVAVILLRIDATKVPTDPGDLAALRGLLPF